MRNQGYNSKTLRGGYHNRSKEHLFPAYAIGRVDFQMFSITGFSVFARIKSNSLYLDNGESYEGRRRIGGNPIEPRLEHARNILGCYARCEETLLSKMRTCFSQPILPEKLNILPYTKVLPEVIYPKLESIRKTALCCLFRIMQEYRWLLCMLLGK